MGIFLWLRPVDVHAVHAVPLAVYRSCEKKSESKLECKHGCWEEFAYQDLSNGGSNLCSR